MKKSFAGMALAAFTLTTSGVFAQQEQPKQEQTKGKKKGKRTPEKAPEKTPEKAPEKK